MLDFVTVAVSDWDGRADTLASEVKESPFNRVVLCVEDRHVKWRKDNVRKAVDSFKTLGLEVVLDPWAVGGLFAGESFGDTRNPEQALTDWLELAATTNADSILWDEPHHFEDVERYIDLAKDITPNIKNVLGFQPERDIAAWADRKNIAEISVSTYLFPPRILRITPEEVDLQVDKWLALLPAHGSVWVQNWGLLPGTEWLPPYLIGKWREHGIPVNVWAWDAFRTVSEVRPANFETVWADTLKALG